MNIIYTKGFQKDISQIKDQRLKNRLSVYIELFLGNKGIENISNIKKMKGTDNLYRLRIGYYRLGFQILKGKITFIVFKHRKDIYKIFP